ncbi:MAG: ParB/RepB/Spo0J family partition protein [Lachnospiraceae bacterium]
MKPSPAASSEVNGYGADYGAGTADGQVVMLKIRQIESNKNQPRKKFDEDSLTELAESIRNYGVLQPVLVQKSGDFYEIVAGERRWRAARMAGLKEIPAIVCDYSEQEKAQVTLIENLQREDLDPIEEAQAYKTLIETYHLTQDEIADRLSRSRTVITNSLRLLKLNAEVQKMLSEGLITQGHAKVLLGIPNGEVQLDLANKIMDEGLSVRETEKIVKQLLNKKPPKPVRELSNQSLYNEYEEKLRNRIGTKVTIQRKAENKGRVEIEYYSDEDLQKILDLIGI